MTDLLQSAQQAIKAGDKQTARQLLLRATRQHPHDHRSWLWLAGVTTSPHQSLSYIQRAAQLRPHDPTIQKAQAWAEKKVKVSEKQLVVDSGQSVMSREQLVVGSRESVVDSEQSPIPNLQSPIPNPQSPISNPQSPISSFDHLRAKSQQAHAPDEPPERWALLSANKHHLARFGTAILLLIFIGFIGLWISQLATPETALNEPTPELANRLTSEDEPSLPSQPASISQLEIVPTITPQPIAPKSISDKSSDPRPTWTTTPLPTRTPQPTPTVQPTFVSTSGNAVLSPIGITSNERWIDVNLTSQYLIAYEGLTPVYETWVSSGLPEFPTVTGQFRIWLRFESQTMDGTRLGYDYYLEGVPHVMYFYQDYALHGATWHNNFGNPMSHGCVNLHPDDARWLFDWASLGTLVNVHY